MDRVEAWLSQQEAEIRKAAQAEIDKIHADLAAKLKANTAAQAEVKAQMAKEQA